MIFCGLNVNFKVLFHINNLPFKAKLVKVETTRMVITKGYSQKYFTMRIRVSLYDMRLKISMGEKCVNKEGACWEINARMRDRHTQIRYMRHETIVTVTSTNAHTRT